MTGSTNHLKCVICGAIRFDPKANSPAFVRRMLSAIVYRGRGDEGFPSTPPVVADSGHRSTIELRGGTQPTRNERGALAVVFNGVICDFHKLRNGLEANGRIIGTRCELADKTSSANRRVLSNRCNQSS
jgi:asparagine synthetase B (glutamine-hydrolysing)